MLLTAAITAGAGVVTGRVLDSAGEPLPDATIRVLAAADSAYVNGAATDLEGRFSIKGLRAGKFIIQANYIGFNPATHNVSVAASGTAKVPEFRLTESSVMLKEATVTAVKTPIKVMEDTVEFNADSYKTQPNAVVEDLLKRLPGVEVGSDGSITANGQTVTKILIDGREFFNDDPAVASKNLPVEMVDKLQVVQRKSDLARLTGVDDGEDETVINLTVKKGKNNGWFGNAEVGYGTDSRYKGSMIVNRFWDGNQMTVIGNANNINDLGFTDGNGNRFRRFGGNNGINTSQSLGMNFNVGRGERFRVGGDIMYSHSDRRTTQRRERQYLFTDSTSYENSDRDARDKGHNLRADFRVQWNPDSFNTLEFRPNFSLNFNDSRSAETGSTLSGLRIPVTDSRNIGNSDGKSIELRGSLIYSHKFRSRPGRSFSISANYNLSNVREHENTYSWNKFYMLDDSVDVYDQFTDNHTWSNQVGGRLSWTEPLGNVKNGRFLVLSYNMRYRWNNADKLVYDRPVDYSDPTDPVVDYDAPLRLNQTNSNRFRNDFFNQNIRIGYKQVRKTYTVDAGMALVPTMSRSIDLINSERNIATRWVWNYAPFLRYRYKMERNRSLNFDYMGRTSQPSMSQLQPVADVSDPLRVVVGNPDLAPTFSHNIRLRFQDFNAETQQSIMAMGDAQIIQNSIISTTTYTPETGGQTTTYRNVNGVWNARLFTIYSRPLRNKAFSVNNHLFLNYNQNIGYNDGRRNRSGAYRLNESFAIAYRPDNLELELRPRYGLQITTNSLQSSDNLTVHSYGGSFNGTYYTPFGLSVSTDLNYTATSGYSEGYDKREWMWNAQLSYQFLNDSATISVRAYDILGQNNNINRNVTANYIDDTMYNSLTRYVMVSFAYKFTTFGKGKNPDASNKLMRRWGPPPR